MFVTKVEWFGTLIQLTYTSLAVQINKNPNLFITTTAQKLKTTEFVELSYTFLDRYMHSVKLVVINIRERKMPIYLKDL